MSQRIGWVALIILVVAGCQTRHEVDMTHEVNMTHEVKPIHITLDINLKIDRELDDFFGDIDQAAVPTEAVAK